ncbi:MAG TPA: potassium-transporting ATPase subunit KdpA [Terriglobia bacterium]|nr:potassium-transporting ATPase subunit KdpA [Terriglobia bacterium]
MTAHGILLIAVYLGVLIAVTKPLGLFMAKVFEGERTFLHPVLRPVETLIYRLSGVREDEEQHWTRYSISLIAFSLVSFLFVYVIQRLQGILPFNPMHFGTSHAPSWATPMTPDLAFNTATSFLTNTNWQAYSGENTLSYFVQMAALTVQNFVSPAVGVAAAMAMVRGFARHEAKTVGNFWVDLTRGVLYVFLPLALLGALLLASQGVIQNFRAYDEVKTVEGATQTIAQGPVASQLAIKMLGDNGGGFFNANSAHPYENPTPLSNFLQMLMILAVPAGLTYTFGRMVKDTRQGWAIFAACSLMFLAGVFVAYSREQSGNPILTRLGVQNAATATQPGGNMEGKEVRFGNSASALFATVTTNASCGAINSWHDSFTPLAGLVPMLNIQTDEVIFGGAGAGLYGILLYAIVAVFIAGLMVGRTPEYLGKKIESKEVKMSMLAIIATSLCILVFAALTAVVKLDWDHSKYWNPAAGNPNPAPTASVPPAANVNNNGPHGLSEILYAYSSATENNGSAFAGISVNTPYYNLTLGLATLIGRFLFMIPLIAVGGSLVVKKKIPETSGTFPTHGPLFIGLFVGTVILIAVLTFFPALALGPIVEHFLMHQGKLFSMVLPVLG